jgi:hypothetical protein
LTSLEHKLDEMLAAFEAAAADRAAANLDQVAKQESGGQSGSKTDSS